MNQLYLLPVQAPGCIRMIAGPATRLTATADLELASRTRRQIAIRLLPFLFVLYITNYLDRTSVAYAGLHMSHDLGLSDTVFGVGAGIFFVGYVILQIPGALLIELWSARRAITLVMMAWGSLTVLTALVHSAGQLYLARFVLGAAEAAFFPGVVVYLSHWFVREDRAKATGNFMAAIPLSFIIGSPLAGWILGCHWFGLEGWRWLFVLEGAPAVLLGAVAFFYLTDWPNQANWMDGRQRQWITQTLDVEKAPNVGRISMWQAVRSRPVLMLATAAFLEYFVFYTIAFWFPTILKRVSNLPDSRLGMLGTIPYVVCLLAMQGNGWHSDKHCERRLHRPSSPARQPDPSALQRSTYSDGSLPRTRAGLRREIPGSEIAFPDPRDTAHAFGHPPSSAAARRTPQSSRPIGEMSFHHIRCADVATELSGMQSIRLPRKLSEAESC